MDVNASRPQSRKGSVRDAEPRAELTRKVFNCIVDDTALLQGAKRGTRDGIPKWISEGHMRLFVPLYALSQISGIKARKGKAAKDAGESLAWLDAATTSQPDLVTLQGSDDQYATWAAVERYALPRPLLSEEDGYEDFGVDVLQGDLAAVDLGEVAHHPGKSFSSNESCHSHSSKHSTESEQSASTSSPPTSPPKADANLVPAIATSDKSERGEIAGAPSGSDIPMVLRPLFNYILWRVHQESDPSAAMDSFIFLSDNPIMHKHAQRFGIRSKTVAEMRYIIGRENRDARNRRKIQKKDNETATHTLAATSSSALQGDENARPHSRRAAGPDVFVNGSHPVHGDDDEILLMRAPKGPAAFARGGAGRGRGRGGPVHLRNSSGGSHSQQSTGRPASSRGHKNSLTRENVTRSNDQGPDEPMDPNSFTRPTSSRGRARGGRGLWMPG